MPHDFTSINYLPTFVVQLPLFGDFISELTVNIQYSCKNVGVEGWSFGPALLFQKMS